jgi:hypothetical protein
VNIKHAFSQQLVPCGSTEGQEDMTKLIMVALHNFANGPNTNVLLP